MFPPCAVACFLANIVPSPSEDSEAGAGAQVVMGLIMMLLVNHIIACLWYGMGSWSDPGGVVVSLSHGKAIPGTSPGTNSKKWEHIWLIDEHAFCCFFLQVIFLFIFGQTIIWLPEGCIIKIIQVYLTSQSLGNLGERWVQFKWVHCVSHFVGEYHFFMWPPQQRHAFKSHASCMPWGPHDCGFMVIMVEVWTKMAPTQYIGFNEKDVVFESCYWPNVDVFFFYISADLMLFLDPIE